MSSIKTFNNYDDHEEIKKARRFLESRGLCVMDLRSAPHPIDTTSIDEEDTLPINPVELVVPAKFSVGQNGEPIGYLPLKVVWVIAAGMTLFGFSIANKLLM